MPMGYRSVSLHNEPFIVSKTTRFLQQIILNLNNRFIIVANLKFLKILYNMQIRHTITQKRPSLEPLSQYIHLIILEISMMFFAEK